jgi:Transposase domain (DUF772)
LDKQFEELYPERLLRALLLQYLCGVRSERLLMEQLDYNLLFFSTLSGCLDLGAAPSAAMNGCPSLGHPKGLPLEWAPCPPWRPDLA